MLDKINVTNVVRDHFKTLRNYSSDKLRPYDLILFVVVPIVVAVLFQYWGGDLPQSLVGVIVTSLSVFTGLLLNLLMVSFNVSRDFGRPAVEQDKSKQDIRPALIREVISNVTFAVLVAIITAILVLSFGIVGTKFPLYIVKILNTLIYFFGALFFLTLFMLLKRIYLLLRDDQ